MTPERYKYLSEVEPSIEIAPDELALGWHWCCEYDYLLVGPGMDELDACKCLPKDHPVYKTTPEQPEH